MTDLLPVLTRLRAASASSPRLARRGPRHTAAWTRRAGRSAPHAVFRRGRDRLLHDVDRSGQSERDRHRERDDHVRRRRRSGGHQDNHARARHQPVHLAQHRGRGRRRLRDHRRVEHRAVRRTAHVVGRGRLRQLARARRPARRRRRGTSPKAPPASSTCTTCCSIPARRRRTSRSPSCAKSGRPSSSRSPSRPRAG